MKEASNTLNSTHKLTRGLRNAAIILSICSALSGCSSKEEKMEKQYRKIADLEYMLQQQAENYHRVYIQENIQQDLKQEGADPTINQEIDYALNYANDQDVAIARTKRKLNRAQRKFARMQENGGGTLYDKKQQEERLNTRLEDKYDYIPKEFERSRNAENAEYHE